MLTSIRVDNFRCFRKFSLDPGPFTLILGRNGTGKSSLLEVIGRVVQYVAGVNGLEALFPVWDKDRSRQDEPMLVGLDLTIGTARLRYELAVAHDRRSHPRIIFERLISSNKLVFHYDGQHVIIEDDVGVKRRYPFSGKYSPLSTLPSSDTIPVSLFMAWVQNAWVLRPVPQLMRSETRREETWLKPDLSNIAAWFKEVLLEDPRLLNRVVRSLREVLDGFRDLSLARETALHRTLRFRFSGRGRELQEGFLLEELSDGQRMLFALYALLHAVVSRQSFLCIDEPDNFVALPEIQPWLDEVRDRADSGKSQVMLVSHHPKVVDLLGARYGFWFERRGTRPVSAHKIAVDDTTKGLGVAELVARGWIDG
jgi:predicted ATPase